ncbi:uncharacterized protein EV422DRAFT_347731 [Fimicolochytrium jonesii]|uniref:uncharacterized protein n=1 Tax=Fimicolochytrium jonesii TaxID=1396493 RepID=UPI0022FE48C5|nr:uncharacterized protein EV422DRAFT_347731 [Fimicolochytrium jonesii]KAI8815660.1 hypothetical protein EV422DRAFT_347731 [Fimicolochytrium jonesii]
MTRPESCRDPPWIEHAAGTDGPHRCLVAVDGLARMSQTSSGRGFKPHCEHAVGFERRSTGARGVADRADGNRSTDWSPAAEVRNQRDAGRDNAAVTASFEASKCVQGECSQVSVRRHEGGRQEGAESDGNARRVSRNGPPCNAILLSDADRPRKTTGKRLGDPPGEERGQLDELHMHTGYVRRRAIIRLDRLWVHTATPAGNVCMSFFSRLGFHRGRGISYGAGRYSRL